MVSRLDLEIPACHSAEVAAVICRQLVAVEAELEAARDLAKPLDPISRTPETLGAIAEHLLLVAEGLESIRALADGLR